MCSDKPPIRALVRLALSSEVGIGVFRRLMCCLFILTNSRQLKRSKKEGQDDSLNLGLFMAKTYDFRDLSDSNRSYELALQLIEVLLDPALPHRAKLTQLEEEATRINADTESPAANALGVIVKGWIRLWLIELYLFSPATAQAMINKFSDEFSGSNNRTSQLDLHPIGPIIELGPNFRPGESKTKFVARAREYWDRASEGFFESAKAAGVPVSPARPLRQQKDNQNKFAWLIDHQVNDRPPQQIADGYEVDRQSVVGAIRKLASDLGIELRQRSGGRPPKQN